MREMVALLPRSPAVATNVETNADGWGEDVRLRRHRGHTSTACGHRGIGPAEVPAGAEDELARLWRDPGPLLRMRG